MRQLITFTLVIASLVVHAGARITGLSTLAEGDVYIISIGVDDYTKNSVGHHWRACKSDAELFTQKVSTDFYDIPPIGITARGQVYPYTLTDETATYSIIKETFKEIAKRARPQDHFIFFYAGHSLSDSLDGYLFPYFRSDMPDKDSLIPMHMLSSWMESISCVNQLVISEAGNGQDFAMDLMSSLFENNVQIAEENLRNRIILTTHELGMEGEGCGDWFGGYLLKFIHTSKNLFNVFLDPEGYNYTLVSNEFFCERRIGSSGIYCRMYNEQDFRRLLIRSQLGAASRGPKVQKVMSKEDSMAQGKNYALLISTNSYTEDSGWEDLRNPRRDATSINNLLRERYGFETTHLHDQPLDSVLLAIKQLKRKVNPQDKVFLFIAGHGKYDEDHSDGFFAFSDARSYQQDVNYRSYLPMAKLQTMLNHFRSKQLFVVLDVCFGASFDLSAADLQLPDYSQLRSDQSLESFIQRKDTSYTSRIYMASGRGEVMDYWKGSLNHSPFADKFITALSEEREFFSPGKLFQYVEGNITEPVLKRFGKHEERADFLIPVLRN